MGIVAVVAGRIGVRLIDGARLRVDRLHVAADHVDHVGQVGDLGGFIIFLRVFQPALVAGHAAHLHGDLFVRNLGDVGVAIDAIELAVHAAEEAVFQHRRRRSRFRLCRRREAFQPVTAETHFAGELRRRLVGRCVLRAGIRRPQRGCRDDANETPADAGGDTRNMSSHPQMLGGGRFGRFGHNSSALAGRRQANTPVMIKNSNEFAESKFS